MNRKVQDYEFHPVCTAFPEMDAELYAKRLADYREHPERADDTAVLVAIDEADGELKIADGRHHYRLCKELGYECRFEEFSGTTDELCDLAEARGLNRRHMDETQRAAAVVALSEFRNGGDRKSNTDQSAPVHSDRPTTRKKAAAKAHVSVRTIASASKAAKADPALLAAMRDKKLDAKTAEKVAALPDAERKKVLAADDVKKAAKAATAGKKPAKPGPVVKLPQSDEKDQAADTTTSPAADESSAESPAVDAWGIPVQPHAAEAFAAVPKFKELVGLLKKVRGELTTLAESPGGRLLLKRCQFERSGNKRGGRWVLAELDNAIGVFEDATPRHTDCPYHFNTFQPHGTDASGRPCPLCDNRRFTGDLRRRQVPPDLIAAMRDHYGLPAEGE